MTATQKPLSNVQLELLKLYSTDITDEEVLEVKRLLAQHFAKKTVEAAAKVWEEKGLTNELMDEWLNDENQ